MTKRPDNPVASMDLLGACYQPEIWQVRKDYIYAAITSIQDGLGYAEECLQEHDGRLGRTTRKNKLWAEIMEKDIAQMRLSLEWLRSLPNATNEARSKTKGEL